MALHGGNEDRTWRKALVGALKEHQASDGSWPPVGVWQGAGSVFSTAQSVLALLAPVAYTGGSFDKAGKRERHVDAHAAIARGLEHKDPRVRAAAEPFRHLVEEK